MIVTRYIVTPESGDWHDAHFELRLSDHDRPFHVVLRRAAGQIGLNSMIAGDWGEEHSLTLPEFETALTDLIIEAVDDMVYVLVGDRILSHRMERSQADITLSAAGNNMSWSLENGSDVLPMLQMVHRQGGDAPVSELRVGGRVLQIPETADEQEHVALVRDVLRDRGIYTQFLSSRPLTQAGETLTILDIDPSPLFALTAAMLLPGARIFHLSRSDLSDTFLTELSSRNGLNGIRTASRSEISGLLTGTEGPVLLQGGQAFDLLGAELDALPDERRQHLSIWTTADEIVPGNRVLPCTNAQLQVSPYWVLNRNAATARPGLRPGVDIAVAAYNAKDHLIECVESLLCEGREDVRVIIVDDGSTDGSSEMAATHFAGDARVRVERKPNGGCASARNFGRLVSDASHIAFVDADDFVTPGFFADLYDLSLYTGCEITQGGFDFYDETRDQPYYLSYEEELLKDIPGSPFKAQPAIRLQSKDIIKGQPTIWRKVYRRDFLDAKNIYFPENVRAYDDYIFQIFSLTAARDIMMLPGHKYHYRQHPAQDIRQGDERHFYMLYMFHMLLKRSVDEGWPDFRPYAESVIDSIAWSAGVLRPDLTDSFLRASARFCVAVSKTYGPDTMAGLLERIEHSDFSHHYLAEWAKAEDLPAGAFWSYFSGELYHPDILHMRNAIKRAL